MRKQYFGKNKENNLPACYVVKLRDVEFDTFTAHMNDWGFEKYGYIPEIMDCKENETAIEYDFIYSEEKTLWEEAYKAYKEKYPTAATKRVKVLQGFYDGEWSDICEYDMDETKELKSDWEAYNKNESCPHRIIVRRVKLEKTNK